MSEAVLREVVERLAPLVRRAGSQDEARVAAWLAGRLAPARIEVEEFHDGYARTFALLAAAMAATRRRWVAALATAALVEDVENGPQLARRLLAPKRRTQNVVAEIGSGQRTDTALPIWWPVLGGPLAILLGRRRLGAAISALGVAIFLDVARNRRSRSGCRWRRARCGGFSISTWSGHRGSCCWRARARSGWRTTATRRSAT